MTACGKATTAARFWVTVRLNVACRRPCLPIERRTAADPRCIIPLLIILWRYPTPSDVFLAIPIQTKPLFEEQTNSEVSLYIAVREVGTRELETRM